MGIALWLACGVAVFFLCRQLPAGRGSSWLAELLTMMASSLLLGALATSLDFGGLNEPDWRAGLFVLFGSAGIDGAVRLLRLLSSRRSA